MRDQLQTLLEKRVQQCISQTKVSVHTCPKIEKKKESFSNRSAEIVKAKATGKINHQTAENDDINKIWYTVHFQFLVRQKDLVYIEEEVEQREAEFYKGILVEDLERNFSDFENQDDSDDPLVRFSQPDERISYQYNRLKAIQYAERWWNSSNPAFIKFENDCTNYISQCLYAGGGPMRGYPNRSQGWWMRNHNWSYSWAIANSLRLFLQRSKTGLWAREVKSPDELLLGDIICYDFQGDGRFDHNTIVTGKDVYGMPLVNAHTSDSRMRYWAYEDSTAYTPDIKYKFFTIVDGQ